MKGFSQRDLIKSVAVVFLFFCSRTFVATASRILRPNTVYRVHIVVLGDSSSDLVIKALITKGSGHHIASGVQVADAGSSHDLLLKVNS